MLQKRFLMAAVFSCCCVASVHADSIRVEWAGLVCRSDVPEISTGDVITGSFSYDDEAPSVDGGSNYRIYDTQHVSSFSVNGLSGSRTGSQIGVFDNTSPSYDQFDSRSPLSSGAYNGDLLGGYETHQIFVRFNGWDTLSGLDLPSADDPIIPADWEGHGRSRLDLSSDTNQGPRIEFVVGSFTFSAEPLDRDDDGLNDSEELLLGTDPEDPDTDDDGLLDGTEVVMAEGTGSPDPLDPDSDDDGLLDGEEVLFGTDPSNPDTDGDGVSDRDDPLPTDPGVTSGFIEDELRLLATEIDSLSIEFFSGKNDNVAAGRRNALSNKATAAANAVNVGDIESAIDQLLSLLEKIDGVDSPPDWMFDSIKKETLAGEIALLISLLMLP